MALSFENLLNTKNESDFFITVCTLLKNYHRPGIKCSTELVVGSGLARPYLEVSLYMVLGLQTEKNIGYTREKVWTFRLYADSELSWESVQFKAVGPDRYVSSQIVITTGLENIKQALQQAKGLFAVGDLNDGLHVA